MKIIDFSSIEWRVSETPVAYPDAVQAMEEQVALIRAGAAPECVWLLEHPALYTAGASAQPGHLLHDTRFPVFQTGRGGQYTYHGPGQRVAYVMLDLRRRGADVRTFVHRLEHWIILTLQHFGVRGERREGRVGIWVRRDGGREDKIAAIGVRIRHWVTYHGIAINVDPDLTHFEGIVPCGIESAGHGVTSLWDLGHTPTMEDVDSALMTTFAEAFPEPGSGSPVASAHGVGSV